VSRTNRFKNKALFTLLAAGVATALLAGTQAAADSSGSLDIAKLTALNGAVTSFLDATIDTSTDPPGFHTVTAKEFDPGHTNLVQSAWLNAIGCPTGATIALPNSSFTGVGGYAPFTDTACPTGDPRDQHNEGLLLVKTGPTNNFAAAVAELRNVKGITLTQLGYDIRKSGNNSFSPLGSHCGAGAPRFDVVTTDGTDHFLGCNSPPAPIQMSSTTGWIRLRWDAAGLAAAFPAITPTEVVRSITIVFDEGQDPSGGPDQFGAAVLDNIDVNGTLVGQGDTNAA